MKERTLVLLKPDAVKRNLVGKIIARYEDAGLKIVALKIMTANEKLVQQHYPDSLAPILGKKSSDSGAEIKDELAHGKNVLKWLRDYIMSHLIVAIIFEGDGAIKKVRKITGYTDPAEADKGTIRGDFGEDSIFKSSNEGRVVRNLVHASGNPEEAKKEIAMWFNKSEIY